MGEYQQATFVGGMNLLSDSIKTPENSYRYGNNVRTRFDIVQPIYSPIEISLPTGTKLQSLTSIGEYLIVFIDGIAYYKKTGDSFWGRISSKVTLSPDVDTIYTQLVPLSKDDQRRYAEESANATVNKPISETITGTPSGMICQDGISPAILIKQVPDQSQPIALSLNSDYTKWEESGFIYVPIGKQMAFSGSKLFIVGQEKSSGKWNRLYHSISGRPLDFTINVNQEGVPSGDADSVCHAVDYNDITAIRDLNNSALLVATLYRVYTVEPDLSFVVFGEPAFINTPVVEAGIINQFAITESLGDYAFIDREGIKSFNAVRNFANEGRNSVFSLLISELFVGIVQSSGAAISWDNYSIFSVSVRDRDYEPAYRLVVYDQLNNAYSSVDNIPSQVVQFVVTTSPEENRLFCRTTDSKLLELYPNKDNYPEGLTYAECFIRTRGYSAGDLAAKEKASFVWLLMNTTDIAGDGILQLYADDVEDNDPIGFNIRDSSKKDRIPNRVYGSEANEIQLELSWDNGAELVSLQMRTDPITREGEAYSCE